jgi:hypothetical protein
MLGASVASWRAIDKDAIPVSSALWIMPNSLMKQNIYLTHVGQFFQGSTSCALRAVRQPGKQRLRWPSPVLAIIVVIVRQGD